jgi:hypothetical protein
MVVDLGDIVEHSRILAVGAGDDLLHWQAFPFRAFDEIVGVVHISGMMLVVMEFERFGRHMRRERVIGIGKGIENEGHLSLLHKSSAGERRRSGPVGLGAQGRKIVSAKQERKSGEEAEMMESILSNMLL